jgi:hypothetical protein
LSFLSSSTKIGEQEGGTSPAQRGGLALVGGGRRGENREEGEYSAKNGYTCM